MQEVGLLGTPIMVSLRRSKSDMRLPIVGPLRGATPVTEGSVAVVSPLGTCIMAAFVVPPHAVCLTVSERTMPVPPIVMRTAIDSVMMRPISGLSLRMLSSEVLYNGQAHTSDEFDARKTEAALNAVLTVRNGASLPAAHRSVVRGSECPCCQSQ